MTDQRVKIAEDAARAFIDAADPIQSWTLRGQCEAIIAALDAAKPEVAPASEPKWTAELATLVKHLADRDHATCITGGRILSAARVRCLTDAAFPPSAETWPPSDCRASGSCTIHDRCMMPECSHVGERRE
jgi:hypothetical protein